MRKILSIVASLVLVSAAIAAQHMNPSEKPIKADLTVASDVMFGSTLVKAGDYKVNCDRETITLKDAQTGKTVFSAPCKGRELPEPSKVTTITATTDASGKKTCDKLLIAGSNVEHVF